MNKEDLNEELDKGLIDLVGKRNPYQVPDNYFEQSSDMILSKVKANASSNSRIIQLLKPILSIAAIICIGLFIVFYMNHNKQESIQLSEVEVKAELNKLPSSEIEAYLNNHVDEINEEILFTNTNINNINIYLNDNEAVNEEINKYINESSEADIENLNI